MGKPKVFISSTYYDLKHLRSSLENFIQSLGFESVLSEKGDIAYSPDMPLDESCYREAALADIFVLIIGGRYGAEISGHSNKSKKLFFDRYDSITKYEYKSAISKDVPVYILIESNVYSEYRTFLKNKNNKNIVYAHVDSVNVFLLIEDILLQPKNNPVFSFERYFDIEDWLKEQWAGLFKTLLMRMSSQQQLMSLSTKVVEVNEINFTLKRYLERIIEKMSPKEPDNIIETESKRLKDLKLMNELKINRFIIFLNESIGLSFDDAVDSIRNTTSLKKLVDMVLNKKELSGFQKEMISNIIGNEDACRDVNEVRVLLGLSPIK